MNAVRSLLYALVFYPGSVLYVLAGILVIPLGRGAVRRVADAWAGFNRVCARRLLGIRTRIEGEVPSGPVLVAVKHQSMFETTEIALILDTPATVMKSELGRIPLWGRLTRVYGIIPVDRDGGAAALRSLLRAAGEAEGGRPADRPLPRRHEGRSGRARRRSSRASPGSTGRSACRSSRSRSTAAGSGRGAASSSAPAW